MQCDVCKEAIEAGTTVYRTYENQKPVIACDGLCRDRFDKEIRTQGDLEPQWVELTYNQYEETIPGTEIKKLEWDPDKRVIKVQLALPPNVSLDIISDFSDGPLTCRFSRCELKEKEEETSEAGE